MKKIGYLWHSFYSGNLGVSALSDSNIQIMIEAYEKNFKEQELKHILFGPKGDYGFKTPGYIKNFEYVEVSSLRKCFEIRRKLKECDVVVDIGSGDSFSDIYGFKRFIKIYGLKKLVHNPRERLLISPQTFGPFNSWWSKYLAKDALRNSFKVFSRDELSLGRVSRLFNGQQPESVYLTTDVAFALEKLAIKPEYFPLLSKSRINIGLNVSGLLYTGGYSGKNQFSLKLDYKKFIDQVIDRYRNQENTTVWLIPHVFQISNPSFESDLDIAESLVERFENVKIAPVFKGPRDAKTFISEMDVVLASRMHAAIAAVSTGTACIPLSYSIKFEGLFNSLEYPHSIDLRKVELNDALDIVDSKIANQSYLMSDAISATKLANTKLTIYKTHVEQFFKSNL